MVLPSPYFEKIRCMMFEGHPLFSMENIYRAYRQCRRRKRGTMNAMRFERNLEENMVALHAELNAGTYRPGRSIAFLIAAFGTNRDLNSRPFWICHSCQLFARRNLLFAPGMVQIGQHAAHISHRPRNSAKTGMCQPMCIPNDLALLHGATHAQFAPSRSKDRMGLQFRS